MEQLLYLLAFLLHWRLVLSALGTVALAAVLSRLIPPFTAGYCVALVICGVVFGIYWQGRADIGATLTQELPEPKISSLVAFLGFAFIGFLCGGLVAAMSGSATLGAAALLLGAAGVVLWYRFLKRLPFRSRSIGLAVVALLAGYSPVLLLSLGSAS
ncbi:hypothetical protein [Diaphorobacter sp.]|uniref:hypothetical protein n=1 Tax=Diaphorobacter sp. TaxID=1934310 RepID=UPI00258E9959|nr:hypothetical protein [Diaphorobacter sp.]